MKSKIGIAIILCIFEAGSQMKELPVAPTPEPATEDGQLPEVRDQLLVQTGHASSKTVSDRAAALEATMSPAVVNMVQTTEAAPARQAVLLQVKFAEVDRAAVQQLGVNLFSTGATNTMGATSTQQFGS